MRVRVGLGLGLGLERHELAAFRAALEAIDEGQAGRDLNLTDVGRGHTVDGLG